MVVTLRDNALVVFFFLGRLRMLDATRNTKNPTNKIKINAMAPRSNVPWEGALSLNSSIVFCVFLVYKRYFQGSGDIYLIFDTHWNCLGLAFF